MNRRLSFALAMVGVMVATVAAAFATSAAFSTNPDSSAAAAVNGIGTVPEVTSSSRLPGSDTGSSNVIVTDHEYSVNDAGSVVVRRGATSLIAIKVTAREGWAAEANKSELRLGIPVVEVTFVRDKIEVVFTALLVDEAIITREVVRDEPSTDGDDDNHSMPTTRRTSATSTSTANRGATNTTDDHGSDNHETPETAEPEESPESTDTPEPPEVED